MFVRFTRFGSLDPQRIQPTVDDIADKLLPAMESEEGCVDGFVLVDHRAGRVVGVTLWDSESAMISSERKAARVRADLYADAIDWRNEPAIERYEIVLDRNDLLARGVAATDGGAAQS